MVLKDGQIAEQGSHKELVALDGIFASMWADQVSASDEIPLSIDDMKKEVSGSAVEDIEPLGDEHRGYVVDAAPESPTAAHSSHTSDAAPEASQMPADVVTRDEEPLIDLAAPAAMNFPTSETPDEPSIADNVIRPTHVVPSSPVVAEPLAFPVTDDTSSQVLPERVVTPIPAVTFGASVNAPPSRTGTPDPDSEPKRKRISSQNFQRLARRMSLTTRKQSSSSIIPGLKRESSPRVSTDDGSVRGESSTRNESPAGSVKGDGDKTKLKKEKKEKKEKSRKGTI